jgi:hypothetical protein
MVPKKELHNEDDLSRSYRLGSAQHDRPRQRLRCQELLRAAGAPIGRRQLRPIPFRPQELRSAAKERCGPSPSGAEAELDIDIVPRRGWQRARAPIKPKPNLPAVAPYTPYVSAFAIGDHVSHLQFGEGTVTEIDGRTLTIDFANRGTKQIVDDYVRRRKER